MAKPLIHAISSAKRLGGIAEDYVAIHQFMDSSKSAIADNRHRLLTHNAWFIGTDGPLERAFGKEMLAPRDGEEEDFYYLEGQISLLQRRIEELRNDQRKVARVINVRDVGEQHILEDFQGKFIPTAEDYIVKLRLEPWMNNGLRDYPPSIASRLAPTKEIDFTRD